MTKACKLINVHIFDPQLVYSFMEALTEYDNIVLIERRLGKDILISKFIIEELSKTKEWVKPYLYGFIAPQQSLAILWQGNKETLLSINSKISITNYLSNIGFIGNGAFKDLLDTEYCLTSSKERKKEVKCLSTTYLKASEVMNMLLYTLILMPKSVLNRVFNDVALSINVRRHHLITSYIDLLKALAKKFCHEGNDSYINSINVDAIIVLHQLSIKELRLSRILCLLLAIYRCLIKSKSTRIYIFTIVDKDYSKFIKILEKFANEVRKLPSISDIKVYKYNVYESKEVLKLITQINELIKKYNALIVIFGDHSKNVIANIVNTAISVSNYRDTYMLIVPETSYIPEIYVRNSRMELKVSSVGGYLTYADVFRDVFKDLSYKIKSSEISIDLLQDTIEKIGSICDDLIRVLSFKALMLNISYLKRTGDEE